MAIDLDRYLARIGHTGSVRADLGTLRALHARHAAEIPFENLAAFLGEPVPLDIASLERKLLTPGRGGWCFEHNLLLADVLETIGFEVRRLAARVRWNVPPNVTTSRSHMLLLVTIAGERYIADVGFGGQTLTAPLRLEPDIEQPTPHEPYRLLLHDDKYSLQALMGGEWQAMYVFDLQRQEIADYEVSNWYLANNPNSQFVKGLVCARAEPGRRHALRNTRYAIHYPDGRTERRVITTVDELRTILREDFGLAVPDSRTFDEKAAAMIAANTATA
ncbi:MAG TPA: arylamine N-acetyltransferase [Usitatibacter sp.]|nr:arylamine N-acetyltransferase [Usitatibacter sp.]